MAVKQSRSIAKDQFSIIWTQAFHFWKKKQENRISVAE